MASMTKEYGSKAKAERVFYSMANSGKLTGVHATKKKKR